MIEREDRNEAVETSTLERVRAERDALRRQLDEKTQELERYVYTVSHDLKSPLITITGFLGFLEQSAQAGDVERLRSDVERIKAAAGRMREMLDQLLELSRIGRMTNPPETVSCVTLAYDVADRYRQPDEDRPAVDFVIDSALPELRADRARLEEVFENLVDNAVRFRGEGEAPRVEIGVAEHDGKRAIYVRDNGIGIDPRFHEDVFGLFRQLDPKTPGTGIGLALVKKIVEHQGGRVWVESEGEGRGSTFFFTWPESSE